VAALTVNPRSDLRPAAFVSAGPSGDGRARRLGASDAQGL